MSRAPSRYQELWDQIKKDAELRVPEGITIAAHKNLHARIIKAIQIRKLKDTGYKFLLADSGRGNCKLVTREDKIVGTVKFNLQFNLSDEDL